ncbi:MAG: AraC family transcriptional regulator [Bacteroidota bacterium]
MISVPQAFFDNPKIDVFLRNGRNCVIRKEAMEVNANNERYLAAHAITVVHAGHLVANTPDGERQVVDPGKMILLPRGIYMISDIIPQTEPFRATVFFFDDELIESFLERFESPGANGIERTSFAIFHFSDDLALFLDNLIRLQSAYKHRDLTSLKLLEFLHLVAGSAEGSRLLAMLFALRNRKKQSVKNFMEQNFEKPLGIEDYAYLTGRSVSTFHRDFKRQFGQSPKSWLMEKRMAKAHDRLLASPDLSVTQLAYHAGYDNVSYFIRAFQRQFGISPKQLQIKIRDGMMV